MVPEPLPPRGDSNGAISFQTGGDPTFQHKPNRIMAKSNEQIVEVIQSHRHHLRHVDTRPQKAHKHRYERRKIREFIRASDWDGEPMQQA